MDEAAVIWGKAFRDRIKHYRAELCRFQHRSYCEFNASGTADLQAEGAMNAYLDMIKTLDSLFDEESAYPIAQD